MRIKDTEIKLKYSLRSMLAFEQITGKPFGIKTLTDEMIYLYCVVISNNEIELTFEEFLEILEDNPNYLNEFRIYLENQYKIDGQFSDVEEIEETDDKKKL